MSLDEFKELFTRVTVGAYILDGVNIQWNTDETTVDIRDYNRDNLGTPRKVLTFLVNQRDRPKALVSCTWDVYLGLGLDFNYQILGGAYRDDIHATIRNNELATRFARRSEFASAKYLTERYTVRDTIDRYNAYMRPVLGGQLTTHPLREAYGTRGEGIVELTLYEPVPGGAVYTIMINRVGKPTLVKCTGVPETWVLLDLMIRETPRLEVFAMPPIELVNGRYRVQNPSPTFAQFLRTIAYQIDGLPEIIPTM